MKYSTVLKPVTFYWCIAVPQDAGQRLYVRENVIKEDGGKIKKKYVLFTVFYCFC